MKDPRCIVGLHDLPKPGRKHPVSAAEGRTGHLTLECRRCHTKKTITWNPGPPKPDVDPPMGFL